MMHMEHVFKYICSKCNSRHELRTACGLSCHLSWFAGETSVALGDHMLLLQSFTCKRLLTQNRQSNKNTLHSTYTLQTKTRSHQVVVKNETFIHPLTPCMATVHMIYSECYWVLDLVNSAGEHNSLDQVLVNLDTDLTNHIVQIQIQSRFCGAMPGGEMLSRHDPRTWHTSCVAGFIRSRSNGSGSDPTNQTHGPGSIAAKFDQSNTPLVMCCSRIAKTNTSERTAPLNIMLPLDQPHVASKYTMQLS